MDFEQAKKVLELTDAKIRKVRPARMSCRAGQAIAQSQKADLGF